MNKVQAIIVFAITMAVGYFVGDAIFQILIDPHIVPILGLRPLLAASTVFITMLAAYYIVDFKYNFEKHGGRLFKNHRLFRK